MTSSIEQLKPSWLTALDHLLQKDSQHHIQRPIWHSIPLSLKRGTIFYSLFLRTRLFKHALSKAFYRSLRSRLIILRYIFLDFIKTSHRYLPEDAFIFHRSSHESLIIQNTFIKQSANRSFRGPLPPLPHLRHRIYRIKHIVRWQFDQQFDQGL